MSILIRRSNLMVPITNARFVQEAWRHGSDAITLDLEDGVPPTFKVEARELVEKAVSTVGKGAAEVFVRVNKEFLAADIEASVWPGLAGIVLPNVESTEDVIEASSGDSCERCLVPCIELATERGKTPRVTLRAMSRTASARCILPASHPVARPASPKASSTP